jgi:hypothetical protein
MQVVTTMIVNGEPRTAVEIVHGAEALKIGEALSLAEQEYVAAEVNRHLERISGPVDVENDLFPSSDAEIVNNRSDISARERFYGARGPRSRWSGSRWDRDSWDD